MTPAFHSLLGDLLYVNYAHNRDLSPHIAVETFAKAYPMAEQLEARYQAEKLTKAAIEKAKAIA